MELGLSLGDSSSPFVEASSNHLGLGFNTTLSIGPIITSQRDQQKYHHDQEEDEQVEAKPIIKADHHQLDLLPQLSFPWPPSQNGSLSGELIGGSSRGLDVNVPPAASAAAAAAEEDEAALSSSPNSAASSFQTDLCIFRGGSRGGGGRSLSGGSGGNYYGYNYGSGGGGGKRDSDEDDNGGTRKKLRLSKEQSAYLEESFKEHNTLNPKQKLALANQLNLRPRQVEVWFQNRRARTKLKQTEVDCEYLKRCCETLSEENRRLNKELQELRTLKTSNPFYMHLPATTLTMCPSCERVAPNPTSTTTTTTTTSTTNSSSAAAINANNNNNNNNDASTSKAIIGFPLGKPKFQYPFAPTSTQPNPHQSAAS